MTSTVAVMAKVPGAVAVKSRLRSVLDAGQATELYRCFLLDRLDAVAALPDIAPVVAFTPPEAREALAPMVPPAFRLIAQRGDDLSERLATLLGGFLAEGHSGAIALDSDSPTLPMAYVSEAARVLAGAEADLVLGPSDDGGYYLVGVSHPLPALFEGIPWSTPTVLAVTLERARTHGLSVHLLPAWFDVDTEDDLRRLHREMTAGGLRPLRTYAFVTALLA